MYAKKINLDNLNETQRAEAVELAKRLQELSQVAKAKVKPTFKRIEVQSNGKVGMTLNGMGKPQFFYKSHILALVSDTPEAAALRQEIVAWVQANDLSDKE